MSHSTKTFDRWKHILPHSWPYKVYKQYNEEVSDYLWTADSSYKFVNSQLTKNHVLDTDGVKTHFRLPSTVWNFVTVKRLENVIRRDAELGALELHNVNKCELGDLSSFSFFARNRI